MKTLLALLLLIPNVIFSLEINNRVKKSDFYLETTNLIFSYNCKIEKITGIEAYEEGTPQIVTRSNHIGATIQLDLYEDTKKDVYKYFFRTRGGTSGLFIGDSDNKATDPKGPWITIIGYVNLYVTTFNETRIAYLRRSLLNDNFHLLYDGQCNK